MTRLLVDALIPLAIAALMISLCMERGWAFAFFARIPGSCYHRISPSTQSQRIASIDCSNRRSTQPWQRLMAGEGAGASTDDVDVIFDDAEAKAAEVVVSDATDTKSINVEILQKESFLKDASNLIESMEKGLASGGVDVAPPELEALKCAVEDSSTTASLLSQRIYELLIEKGMRYDLDPPTGRLTPTEFNIKENLDIPAVRNEFFRQYSFGMQAAMTGVLDVEKVKEIVLERLIKRTGLSPEEFDKWLGF
jgi:hypothetical protein